MMRVAATFFSISTIAACASTAINTNEDSPAAATQAAELTCAWLLEGGRPPQKAAMERLSWEQVMTRDAAVIPQSMQHFVKGPPALAGYRLNYGQTGVIIASLWENRCYGIWSVDRMPAPSEVLSRATLAALGNWIDQTMPDGQRYEATFKDGHQRPHVARMNGKFDFVAHIRETGGVEWWLVPMPHVAPGERSEQSPQ